MDAIIKPIEKMKPFFDKVARNKYLKAIKDGFISSMPIILFSSIFLLIAYVPNVFGFYWSKEIEAIIMKPYNYSMGILAIAVAATTTKHFTDTLNREMPANNQINSISTMICAVCGFLIFCFRTYSKHSEYCFEGLIPISCKSLPAMVNLISARFLK